LIYCAACDAAPDDYSTCFLGQPQLTRFPLTLSITCITCWREGISRIDFGLFYRQCTHRQL